MFAILYLSKNGKLVRFNVLIPMSHIVLNYFERFINKDKTNFLPDCVPLMNWSNFLKRQSFEILVVQLNELAFVLRHHSHYCKCIGKHIIWWYDKENGSSRSVASKKKRTRAGICRCRAGSGNRWNYAMYIVPSCLEFN